MANSSYVLTADAVQDRLISGHDVHDAQIWADRTLHLGPGLGDVYRCLIVSTADPIMEYHLEGWRGLHFRGDNYLRRPQDIESDLGRYWKEVHGWS